MQNGSQETGCVLGLLRCVVGNVVASGMEESFADLPEDQEQS